MARPAFKIVSHVTVPVLKIDGTRPVFITFLEPIHIAPESDKMRAAREADIAAGKMVKPVPEICKVRNLEDGGVYQVVANEVFKSEIRQAYPDNSYVNKSFAVNKFAPEGNKKYATFQIAEIELEVAPEDQPALASSTGEGTGEGTSEGTTLIEAGAEQVQEQAAAEHHNGGKRKK